MPAMQFFVMDELTGQQTGPYSLQQIQDQIRSRQLKKKDFVRRADSAQWGKASVILSQVFDSVERQKKEQKNQKKQFKKETEAQPTPAKEIEVNPATKKPAERPVVKTAVVSTNNRVHPKPTLWQMVFGSTRPSPYAGFKFVSILINVLITLTLLATLFMTIGYLGALAYQIYECFDKRWSEPRVTAIIFLAVYMVSQWLGTIIWIGLLVFIRNLIDWLIDMEDHVRSVRGHFRV